MKVLITNIKNTTSTFTDVTGIEISDGFYTIYLNDSDESFLFPIQNILEIVETVT